MRTTHVSLLTSAFTILFAIPSTSPAVDLPYSNDFSSNTIGVDPVSDGSFSTGGSAWLRNASTGVYEAYPVPGAKFQNVAATIDVNPDQFGGDASVAQDFTIHGGFKLTPAEVEFVNGDRPDQFALWFLGTDIRSSIEDKYRLLVQADGFIALERRFGGWTTLATGEISPLVIGEMADLEITLTGDYVDTTDDTFNESLQLTANINAGEYGSETLSVLLGPNGIQGRIFGESQIVVHYRDISLDRDLIGGIDYLEISNGIAEPEGLVGDYNGDGTVDAADYTVFRDNLGGEASAFAVGSRAEANTGPIDSNDYDAWSAAYGDSAAPSAAVPEPQSVLMLLSAVGGLAAGRWLRR